MWLGLALRVWAIAALGGGFRTTVEVEPGQPVVSSGPYRSIRHPSYAGLLLIVAGFGAAPGNWLSLVACVVLPLPAIIWRIHVEEAELNRVLGQTYRAYESDRARLIPRVWCERPPASTAERIDGAARGAPHRGLVSLKRQGHRGRTLLRNSHHAKEQSLGGFPTGFQLGCRWGRVAENSGRLTSL